MLDIKTIRDNPEFVKARLKDRQAYYDKEVDRLLELDKLRRDTIFTLEGKKAQQNTDSKKIPQLKKAGEDASAVLAEMKQLSEEITEMNTELAAIETEQRTLLLSIPNIPTSKVIAGKDSDENVEQRRWGEPTKFDFEPKPHWELGEQLGILDPATAAKVTGARFHYYSAAGAAIERAVYCFYLHKHTSENGYT